MSVEVWRHPPESMEIPYERWIMRNNVSTRKNALKALTVLSMLVICFVFVFAFTLAQATSDPEGVAFAATGKKGGSALVTGSLGAAEIADFNGLNFSFPGNAVQNSNKSYSVTENFNSTYFNVDGSAPNVSLNNSRDDDAATYSWTNGTGTFGWNADERHYDHYMIAIVNYKLPAFITNIMANSNLTVTVTISASLSKNSDTESADYGIVQSDTSASAPDSADDVQNMTNSYKTKTVTLSSGKNYIVMGFSGFANGNAWPFPARVNAVTVSSITLTYTITMKNSISDSSSTSINDGAAPVVAEEYNAVGTANSYTPYLTDASTASTWPVWYDSIQSTLNKAKDNIENGAGKLQSYTSKQLSKSLTNSSGNAQTINYYKYSKVEFVDAYDYTFSGAFNKLTKGNITVANFQKVAGLGDKFLSNYNAGTYSWTTGDVDFGAGIQSVQVGDADGAVFNMYTSTDVGRFKVIKVGGVSVGYAVITKTNRARIIVETYMYDNAKVATKVTDYGGQSVTKNITYSGIDKTNPVAPTAIESDYVTLTGNTASINGISWIRTNTYTSEIAPNTDNDATNGQDSFSPYIWFYVVDKDMTASGIASKSARTYSDYAAIQDANLTPIACGNFSSFKYDFVNGKATGLNGAQVGNAASIGDCKGSGYYRFTFFTVDLSGRKCSTNAVFYAKVDIENPTFDMGIEFITPDYFIDEITKAENGKWATGETTVMLTLAAKGSRYVNNNSTNISGNTLVFDAGSETFAIVFNATQIVSVNGTAVGATTFTFNSSTVGKIQTLASEVEMKVTYHTGGVGTPASFEFEFPELKSTGATNQVFPNIDWTTVFTLYAGVDYQTDNMVFATDGWTGGVKILVDKNRPQTPTLEDEGDYLISALGLYDNGIGNYTLSNVVTRNWFTTTGLSLPAQLAFQDDMTELYGDSVKVYIGVRTIKSNADFDTFNELAKSLAVFATDYPTMSAVEYAQYLTLTVNPSGSLDGGLTDLSVNLKANDNAGLRMIFVWAVDQAGNVSDLSQYYVLADANTYTINSNVVSGDLVALGSAHIVQKDFEGNEGVKSFKRGETVTFEIQMNTTDDNYVRYAPYTFKKTDGAGQSLVLYNYSSNYEWNIVGGFEDNISLDNSSFAINYIVDDFSRVDMLNAVIDGSFKKITFDFAHREIVTYTVTNWQSAYTGVETQVTMTVSNDQAKPYFEYYYLDYSLAHIATPIYPNTELAPNYYLAIFIPTDNPNYVVQSNNKQIVSEYAGNYYYGYVADAEGTYKLENGEYVELDEDELINYTGTRYARPLDRAHMENVKLHHGYQKVDFAVYKIGKGSATVKALASSTKYGDSVTLNYILQIGGKNYIPYGAYYYYEDEAGTYKRLEDGSFVELTGGELTSFEGTRYARTQYELTGVQLELYTTATAPYTDCSIGAYTIIQTGNMSLEYFTIEYESAIHTINTRPVKIVVLADTKVYGNADPDFRFSVNLSEFGSESALISFFSAFGEYTKDGTVYTYHSGGAVRRANGENVGEYGFVANNAAFDIDTNYSLNIDVTTNVFTITKRTVMLIANGQSAVKLASDNYNADVDWASIFPTYTLSNSDLQFAGEIVGHLGLDGNPVDIGGNADYEYRYQYDVTLGTVVDTNNLHFVIDNPSTFVVYITYADATVIKLRSGQAFTFVFGTEWVSSLVDYSYEMFEGLAADCTVTWTATIEGAGAMPDAGSYRVTFSNVVAKDSEDNVISRVVVEAFNVTFEPAVIVVAPTYTSLKKGYGDVESTFGIGFEIVSIAGKNVGTGEGEISEYAGYSIAEILNTITGAYARALFSGGNMLALGTRYDDASDANGVLYSDDSKHYGFAVSTKFSVANANFAVDSTLSAESQAIRFEIEKHQITVSRTAFVGVDKVIDNTSVVNYRDTQVADIRSELVLSTDDVQIDYVAHYVDKDDLTVEKTTEGKAKIVFDSLGLKGEQAANYVLYINPSDLDPTLGKVVIEFHDNLNNTTSIRITTGSIAIANKDYVTISKQYDGTNTIEAANVRIAEYTDGAGVGTKILCNLLDSARVISGAYGGTSVNANYVLSIELFFPIGTNKDDLDRFTIEEEENATDVVIKKSENAYGGYYGIIVKINNQKAVITKREINAKSFVTGSLAAVTRDYNSLDTVDVRGTLTDTALVAGDEVKLSIVGVVDDANYGVDGKKTGTFAIRFDSFEISNSNYIVDIDNLNATYAGDKALKATINRAKLLPNYSFADKVYDGTANVTATPVAGYDFTTVNYPTELTTELSALTYDIAPTFALSSKGVQNGNVIVEDGKVVAHDILVSGLRVLAHDVYVLGDKVVDSTTVLKNYEIYGYRYANGEYVAVGTVHENVVADYEILKIVEVAKRQVVVDENHINVHDKIYDGTKDAGASIRVDNETNIVAADQTRIILSATGEFAQKQVGDKIEVKISNITLGVKDEADAYLIDNYSVGSYSGAIIEKKIFERPITFTTTLGTKVYSGDMVVSNNVINYTFEGFLGTEGNTYGIQTKGGAYYFDKNASKNLFIADENGTYKLDDKGNYVTLSKDELATYTGTRYAINFDKQGTVYNPTLMNTKAHYMNYRLTNAVAAADYDGTSEYYACEFVSGEVYRYGDPRITGNEDKIATYFFNLEETQRYIEVAKTNKYILASNDAWVEAARAAGAIIVEKIADPENPGDWLDIEKTFHVGGQLAYLVDKTYDGSISGTLATPVAYKDANYHQAELDDAFVGFYINSDGKEVYYVTDDYSGAYQTAAEAMKYSNNAYGRIRKKVAVINEVTKLNADVFTKQYDGTTKFYGVAGVDYTYNEDNIGLVGDDLYIVGVVAKFEKSTVGTVYVSFEAESLGGADADNYSYGTIRSARLDGRIEKRTIDASLGNGTMVYGSNYISGMTGNVEYTLDGKALFVSQDKFFIKLADFLEVVGLDPVADATYVEELTKHTYNKLEGGTFERLDDASGEYIALSGNFNLPIAKPTFDVTRPSAGTTSNTYKLFDGEASNFEFRYSYTGDGKDGVSSRLEVVQKDLYVVAELKDYQKDYAGEDPAINLNYVDINGNSAFASGETWQNAFGKKGEFLPKAEFWLFDTAGNLIERVSDISKVNDGNDNTFSGNYVLVISLADGFDAASSNYNVHCGEVVLISVDEPKNARYKYVYDNAAAAGFTPYAPELTINLPTVSGVYIAATAENDYALTTTYKYDADKHESVDQTGIALTGVKKGDVVYIIDENGNEVHAEHAGVYQGVVVLRRSYKANDSDPNNYSAYWRSDVNPDVKVTSVKITVEKASTNLFAKAGSIVYDGLNHEYNISNVTVGAADLEIANRFSVAYKKKVGGDLVSVNGMKDAGSYIVYITYDSGNPDYLVETYDVQYSIIPATVTVRISGDGRFFYTQDGFAIDFEIEKLNPTNAPISKSDMFIQILLGGKSLFKVNEYNRIVPIGDTVSKNDLGQFLFKTSGKYAIQVVLKDSSQEGNYNIVNGAGNIELVVSEISCEIDGGQKASLEVKNADDVDEALLVDSFEVRYVYNKNNSADDDLYFAKLNSSYYLSSIEDAVGTSASILAVVRMQLTCNGKAVELNGTSTTVSVELTSDILSKLDKVIIYTTVTQADNTVKLQKLTNYEIKDGVLTYETTELGSIVFVRVGRDVPMLAIWVSAGVVGGIVVIIVITAVYVALKRKKLKKMMLE